MSLQGRRWFCGLPVVVWVTMELADFIRELLRHKLWVAVSALVGIVVAINIVYDVDYTGFKLHSKHFESGAATTQMLVDSAEQPLGDYRADLTPLVTRAGVYAQLMTSRPVLRQIAHDAGLPVNAITAVGPSATGGGAPRQSATQPVQRDVQLAEEGRGYRLAFSATPEQPTVSIFAQAPTPDEAAKLANAAVTGFQHYLARSTATHPEVTRIQIRPLGPAVGGSVVTNGTGKAVGALVALVVFAVGCFLIVFLSGVIRNIRRDLSLEVAAEGEEKDREDEPEVVSEPHDDFEMVRTHRQRIASR